MDKDTRPNRPFVQNDPRGTQWVKGQSGNPKGPPKHRTHLWTHTCKCMQMTDTELTRFRKEKKKKLTQSEHAAVRIVMAMRDGRRVANDHFAKYMIDRDEGKPMERVTVQPEETMTDEECEQIRQQCAANQQYEANMNEGKEG